MFKRKLEMRVVKDTKPGETNIVLVKPDMKEVTQAVKTAVVGTGFVALELMGTYMVLDTVRKIAVNRLSKK
jgi:hypothetical protein